MSSLARLVSRFGSRAVTVVGDVMLDHFVIGRADRISPEAPVPVVLFDRESYRLGGAGNVAVNLSTLGARVNLIGVVGADDASERLSEAVASAGISTAGLVADAERPTTRKVRVVTTRNQQVARIDYERDADIANDARDGVIARLTSAAAQAMVISDYRKGVVTEDVIAASIRAARAEKVPLLVDPKVPVAERYRGATLITPNHHEAELMTQRLIRSDDDARAAARALHDRTGASVLITRGEHGMWVFDATGASTVERALGAVAREVSDVTGAGDTVIAVLALSLAAGATLVQAAELANVAAGLVVARFGPAAVTAAELTAAIAARPH
ncbi:MAG TPA: PfkB family carbohydrate kinase [Vicinamibacterales bacterium]|nr:PfkB family carbohydrate kinase [Vicinamibacterales bacterium]